MITGAPSTGVTALRGKTVPMPGTTVSKLQSNAMHEPVSIVTGSNMR